MGLTKRSRPGTNHLAQPCPKLGRIRGKGICRRAVGHGALPAALIDARYVADAERGSNSMKLSQTGDFLHRQ